jgi:hypothetical protein
MGFSSFKNYGCKFSKKLLITILSPTPTPVTTTTKLLIAGGLGGNTISLSTDNGVSWTLPNNQPFTSRAYNCDFDGKRIVMGGNANIAYSDDYGINWVLTGFSSMAFVNQIKYITEKNIWFALGSSPDNNCIAYSSDGINWTYSNIIFNGGRVYDLIYNGNLYVAAGWGDYPTATSSDGITWTYNTTLQFQTPGRQYCFGFFMMVHVIY